MDEMTDQLVADVAAAISRLTGQAVDSITVETPLSEVLPMVSMRLALIRQLERQGTINPLLDSNIPAWAASSRGWSTVGSIIAVVRQHGPRAG